MVKEGNKREKIFYGWYILACGFVILLVAWGVRLSFGVFFKPVLEDFALSRAGLSLAVSINAVVYGITQPVWGYLLDRYGPKFAIGLSATLTSSGFVLLGLAKASWQLYLIFALLLGGGFGGVAFVTITAIISRWFVKRRGTALGVATSGSSLGQFIVVPLATLLMLKYGWRMSQLLLGLISFAIMMPLAVWVMRGEPAEVSSVPNGNPGANQSGDGKKEAGPGVPASTRPAQAFLTSSFWELAGGFFICGFTSVMVSTHFVAYATDVGHSEVTAASALALMGVFNTVGTIFYGSVSDWIGCRRPLAVVYFLRGLSYFLVLGTPGVASLYFFAIFNSLNTMATVPLNSALVSNIFGPAYVGTIFGVVSLSHQLGGAVGTYLAGLSFDLTGSYVYAFVTSIFLCLIAALLSWLIQERPKIAWVERTPSASQALSPRPGGES